MQIGTRLALGSGPLSVVGMVISDIAIVTAIDLAVGFASGIATSRLITTRLFEVKPFDIWSVTAPLVSLLLACALAALLPALRATRVDPMTASKIGHFPISWRHLGRRRG